MGVVGKSLIWSEFWKFENDWFENNAAEPRTELPEESVILVAILWMTCVPIIVCLEKQMTISSPDTQLTSMVAFIQ